MGHHGLFHRLYLSIIRRSINIFQDLGLETEKVLGLTN